MRRWQWTTVLSVLFSIFASPAITQQLLGPTEPDSTIVVDLCQQIADPKTRNVLLSQSQGIEDINNDGVPEVSKSCWGGTMGGPCVEYFDKAGAKIAIEKVDFEWKDYWTFGIKPFRYNARTFFLHSSDNALREPSYVSYIAPTNREYVVCEFTNTIIATLDPQDRSVPKVCSAILKESPAVKPIGMTETIGFTLEGTNRSETTVKGSARVDIDNDGTSELVVELLFASSGGRGGDFNYFELLNPKGTRLSTTPKRAYFLTLQRLEQSGPGGGSYGSIKNRLLRFERKTYYETNFTNNEIMPRTIAILEGDKVQTVCTFGRAVRTSVK